VGDMVPTIAPPPPPPAAPRMTPLEAAIAKAQGDANRRIETDEQGLVVWDEEVERPATAEDVRS